jgi:hypothetical protein
MASAARVRLPALAISTKACRAIMGARVILSFTQVYVEKSSLFAAILCRYCAITLK